jgi:hypothetical protein
MKRLSGCNQIGTDQTHDDYLGRGNEEDGRTESGPQNRETKMGEAQRDWLYVTYVSTHLSTYRNRRWAGVRDLMGSGTARGGSAYNSGSRVQQCNVLCIGAVCSALVRPFEMAPWTVARLVGRLSMPLRGD